MTTAFYSDPAGKYDPTHPMRGNEDNFYLDTNLGGSTPGPMTVDHHTVPGPLGTLLAVADGMGGMNAGEIASEIAIATVREYFTPPRLTAAHAATPQSRAEYMEEVIRQADLRIKADAQANPAHRDMGSTLVMAWLLGSQLTVTWIGDSRAYLLNTDATLQPLSKDHSLVQKMVDAGVLTPDEAFSHPQGNIVTRSLGDPSTPAQAESAQYTLTGGQTIMLCSDGLSGILTDTQMAQIMAAHPQSLDQMRKALWQAAEQAGWYDNVTALLLRADPLAKKIPWLNIAISAAALTIIAAFIAAACVKTLPTKTPSVKTEIRK